MKSEKSLFKFLIVACMVFAVSINVHSQSKTVLSTYMEVKDALVETNGSSASEAAGDMVALLRDKSDELSKKLLADAKAISSSKDAKIQRKHFNTLSQNIYEYVKETNDKEGTVYKQFCPMAFNNTGAYWLAAEKEINNPYFGSMMLHCGIVKEKL